MKILMVVTWFGEKNKDKTTGNFHRTLAKALSTNNEVAILFPFDSSVGEKMIYGYEDEILVFRTKVPTGRRNVLKRIKQDYGIIRTIFNPDIVHAHVVEGTGELALMIKCLFHTPYILTEHAPIEMLNTGIKSKLKYCIVTFFSKANIAVSPNQCEKLNSIYRYSNFKYINNGVVDPLTLISCQAEKYTKERVINCGIVAGLYSKDIKGLQFLLPAIEKLVKEGQEIHLHICGGGTYLEYYKEYSKRLNIDNNVSFYGWCSKEKVYSIISQMNFMISASLFESAGISVEESCMLGKPQLITDSGGANSLISDCCAMKIGKSSVEELYYGIKEMITKYNEYDNETIRKYGLAEFSIERVCDEYEKIYKLAVINYKKGNTCE